MKILLDTNIVLDLLLERKPFVDFAEEIFINIEKQEIEGFLSPTSITTIYYLLNKYLDKNRCNETIKTLLDLFDIVKVDKKILRESLENSGIDFEDSVIYTSANFANIDIIITRDKKGFKNSKTKVLSPAKFLKEIEKNE
jgi:predicted nucleic acid-binding protein